MEIGNLIKNSIEYNMPIAFLKFGDGEFNCITGVNGRNCDLDDYTQNLRNKLRESFQYIVNNTENVYLGFWSLDLTKQLEELVERKPKWGKYHTIMFEGEPADNLKAEILKAIRFSPRRKIIVCNPLLIKAKMLIDASDVILINYNNWFDKDFDRVLEEVKSAIGSEDGNHIIITCAGMGSKVLLAELIKLYPGGIYLDYGSSLDKLCTKKETRGWNYSYEYLLDLCKDIIPDNWNDTNYDYIYDKAKGMLGMHLP